jgi:hypothetical protein
MLGKDSKTESQLALLLSRKAIPFILTQERVFFLHGILATTLGELL